jgi:ABC-type oligopeptide transport system substrate-binding subunit
MKLFIPLSTVLLLAAAALVGCSPDKSTSSGDTATTSNMMSGVDRTMGGTTNMLATNSLPMMNTNMPVINSVPVMNTNVPTSTNQ